MAPVANRIDDITPVLIEEQVDTGLKELMESFRPTYTPGGSVADELDERFLLHVDEPLKELDHPYAQAFKATDRNAAKHQAYALVLSTGLPYRQQAITDAIGLNNPYVSVPLGAGTMRCSHLNESRFVIFLELPKGRPLTSLIQSKTRLHESKVISNILLPACQGLIALRERKIHHGNLRPETFFYGDTPMLGECFSALPSALGSYLYESSERMMADPLGQGDANEKSDVFALGMLAFELMYGLEKFKAMTRDEFIQRVLRQGTYGVLAGNRDFPAAILDFFRGTLNDNIVERWTLDQTLQFLEGKRFNLIAPAAPKDASRPFNFAGESILGRRLLAHLLHRNWREAVKDIYSLHIERWCESGLHRPELVEPMERAVRIGSDRNANERQISDMMVRVLTLLDTNGPLRSRSLSVRPDGIPVMYAALYGKDEAEFNQLVTMIDSDAPGYWSEQSTLPKTNDFSQAIWRIQRARPFVNVKNRMLGFGFERALYDLNPSLPCQSPLVKAYHITSVPDLLLTLNVLAKSQTAEHSIVDKHIAGFIASKIDMRKQVRLADLTSIHSLHNNQDLIMLLILGKAQQRHPHLDLVGLATLSAMHIEKMLAEVHNRLIRKQQKLKLKKRAASGNINEVLVCVLNRDVGDEDNRGFVLAMAQHEINFKKMEFLNNPLIVQYRTRKMGGQMALMISYIALCVMSMRVISQLLGL